MKVNIYEKIDAIQYENYFHSGLLKKNKYFLMILISVKQKGTLIFQFFNLVFLTCFFCFQMSTIVNFLLFVVYPKLSHIIPNYPFLVITGFKNSPKFQVDLFIMLLGVVKVTISDDNFQIAPFPIFINMSDFHTSMSFYFLN